MLDVLALKAVVYNRLKTDGEGASVRAALGAADASVIDATKLRLTPLPKRPFLTLRRGAAPSALGLEIYTFRWWIYDDSIQEYVRINALIPLIGSAYDAKLLRMTGGVISSVDISSLGAETEDPALNLLVSFVDVIINGGKPTKAYL